MAKEYGITALPTSLSAVDTTLEIGWRFTVGSDDITVSGLRVILPNVQTTTLNLWKDSASQKLASVSITATANQWSEGYFSEPVRLQAGERYTVSCYVARWSYTDASKATFNPKIVYTTSAYGYSPGGFPTNSDPGYLYTITDIIIAPNVKTSGTAILSLANYTVGGDDSLYWTATVPEGTSVAVSTSVNNGAWQSISNAGMIQGLPARGQTCNLRIKIDLATTDNTQTPAVSGMAIRNSADKKILVLRPSLPNLSSAVGNIAVSYDGLGGLGGTGGPTAAFAGVFTPSGLTWKGHQNDAEHIAISASINAVLKRIIYSSAKVNDEHISISAAASATLTNIHDL